MLLCLDSFSANSGWYWIKNEWSLGSMDPSLDPLRFSVSVPMVSLEEPLDSSAELVAAKPLDDGASFIRMRLLDLSVFGFADPFALLLQRRPPVLVALGAFAIKTDSAELSSRAKGFQQKSPGVFPVRDA